MAFTFPKCCPRSAVPLLWDGLGHGGERASGQDGDDSWEMTAGTDLGCAGAGAPPTLILNLRWLFPPQSRGRAGAAPLSSHLLGPQGDLERSGAGHMGMPGLSHQGDLGAVHPTQLTEHSQEQEGRAPEVGFGPGCATGPGRWPGCSRLPRGPRAHSSVSQEQRGRGLEGTRCDRRNCASISEYKDSHHLHLQLPRATHSRQDAWATSNLRGASSSTIPARQERAGTGAASGGCWIPWL